MKLARRSSIAACALAGLVAGSSVASSPSAAQDDPDGRDRLRDQSALVSVEIDVLRADNAEVSGTLVEIRENVATQKALLIEAQNAHAAAEQDLAAAEAALADTQRRLDEVNSQADLVVVDTFVDPPAESALDALTAESLVEATVKQSILDRHAESNAGTLSEYEKLQEQLGAEEEARAAAAAAAEAAKAEAAAALDDVEAAVSQQVAFAVEVEQRLDRNLSEAAAVENVDPELAERIRAREAELASVLEQLDAEVQAAAARDLAAQLSELADARGSIPGVKPVEGGVVAVACPAGGSIEVAGAIAQSVERLLADAYEAGVSMCGFGYRDPAEQVAVRRANCGSTYWLIYQAPSSYCSPPTARPGASMHEQGLAIDFSYPGGGTIGWGSSGYYWLKDHAADYGLYNLPSEPWHWSVDGT